MPCGVVRAATLSTTVGGAEVGLENRSVLFTDMVGSTALTSRVSAETADDVRRRHFSILRQAIAETGGTEVKNLGDGLMVVFAAASAAVACAVAMQRGVERDNRRNSLPIGLRIGLSCGEVTAEEDDYFGDPVIEAARLCARCDAGQILASELVRLTAGRRSRHEYVPVGSLALKGLREPVATTEVRWEAGDDDALAVPLPSRMSRPTPLGFVGRDAELELVRRAYERVTSGAGREVVLLAGAAGLGKTTLTSEAARVAHDAGACVLFGHCEEDLATPYQLFAEAVGHWAMHAAEEDLRAHVASHGAELARLAPALRSRVKDDLSPPNTVDPDTERALLFSAVVGLFAALSARHPVVVVFDDLQWADPASLQLLRHLVASDHPMRLLVIGAYREAELPRTHPLVESLAALHREHGVSFVELAGLNDEQVVTLMEAAAGHDLDAAGIELARAVHRETDGNPLFVTEVLRHLAETGAIRQDPYGRWSTASSSTPVAIPASIRIVINARVGRLGSAAEQALSMAAVIGREFELDVLAHATGLVENDLFDILDAATGASLVDELDVAGRYRFSHALIQRTLYDELGPSRVARSHHCVAESIEALRAGELDAHVGELARHWLLADRMGDPAKALEYSLRAGDAALSALAPGDAIRHFEAGLELAGAIPDRRAVIELDLSIGLGVAQRRTGDPAFRETLLGAARRADALGDVDRLTAAVLANSRGSFMTSVSAVDDAKVALLERALERLASDHPDRALVLATLCSELMYGSPLERRQALAAEAVALAGASGDDETIVRVSNLICAALDVPGNLASSLARTADALARAEHLGDPVLVFWAAHWRAELAAAAGEIDEVDRSLELRRPCIEKVDQPDLHWFDVFTRCWRAQIAGDPDEVEALAARALELGVACGEPDAELFFGVQAIVGAWMRGSLGDAVPLLEDAVAAYPGLEGYRAMLALANLEGERLDDARRLLDEFVDGGCNLPADQAWMGGMVAYAEVAIELRHDAGARALHDQLAPYRDQFATLGAAQAYGPVSHYLGGLADVVRRHEAGDLLAEAAAMNERLCATFFAARTHLARGRLLAGTGADGDRDGARALLSRAHTAATEHGYRNVARRAKSTLQAII